MNEEVEKLSKIRRFFLVLGGGDLDLIRGESRRRTRGPLLLTGKEYGIPRQIETLKSFAGIKVLQGEKGGGWDKRMDGTGRRSPTVGA